MGEVECFSVVDGVFSAQEKSYKDVGNDVCEVDEDFCCTKHDEYTECGDKGVPENAKMPEDECADNGV